MSKKEYSIEQLKIINGEKSLKDADGRGLHWFYKKAVENEDMELAQKIKEQIEILKAQAKIRALKRNSERKRNLRHEYTIEWRQPTTNKYTKHQEQVVRGEIPFETVHTNELISIHLKARNAGDFELSKRIFDVIYERRSNERCKYVRDKKKYNKRNKKTHSIDFIEDSPLNVIEQDLINGDAHWSEYSVSEIKTIIKKLENSSNTKSLAIAQNILYYKQHPRPKYTVEQHQEAIDALEKSLKTHFKRPNN